MAEVVLVDIVTGHTTVRNREDFEMEDRVDCPNENCDQSPLINKDGTIRKHNNTDKTTCSMSGSKVIGIVPNSQPNGNIARQKLTFDSEETFLDQVLNGTKPIPTSLPSELSQLISTRHSTKSTMSETAVPDVSDGVSPNTVPANAATAPDAEVPPTKKSSFNYLLLDPSELDKIDHNDQEFQLFTFKHFVESIFYVGMGTGTGGRPFIHLKEAASLRVEREGNAEGEAGGDAEGEAGGDAEVEPTKKVNKKEKILNIWREERGVVILHLFHCCTDEEAHNKEACLIDIKGLKNLTNERRVKYKSEKWEDNKDRLGVHLLYKAFKIYFASPPQEIYKGEH